RVFGSDDRKQVGFEIDEGTAEVLALRLLEQSERRRIRRRNRYNHVCPLTVLRGFGSKRGSRVVYRARFVNDACRPSAVSGFRTCLRWHRRRTGAAPRLVRATTWRTRGHRSSDRLPQPCKWVAVTM